MKELFEFQLRVYGSYSNDSAFPRQFRGGLVDDGTPGAGTAAQAVEGKFKVSMRNDDPPFGYLPIRKWFQLFQPLSCDSCGTTYLFNCGPSSFNFNQFWANCKLSKYDHAGRKR